MAIAKDQVKKDDYGYKNLLKVADLVSTHEDYDDFVEEWRMLLAVYEGIKWIKYYNYIKQHEREPDDTYERRMDELYSFDYSKSIVDIFHYYLFKKDPKRIVGSLQDNEFWEFFQKDANLYGDTFDEVIMATALYASIEGHIGLLVDMPDGMDKVTNLAQQKKEKLYAYISTYFPNCILDWKWGKNEFGKPCLEYVKLFDDNGQYRIWTRETWEVWEIPEEAIPVSDLSPLEAGKAANLDAEAKYVASGVNPLGEVPFVWHYNARTKIKGIGRSDITEVARIDLSIIRNLSQSEEIIGYAAFPMLLKPMRSADPRSTQSPQQEDVVSVDAVQEFDPQMPESKPEWMKTEVAGPLAAIADFIMLKVSEIYRTTNTGGIATTEVSKDAKSGVALTAEFKLLNSQLVTKAILLEKTENRIVRLWLMWMNLWDTYKDVISLQRDRTFDVENLAQDLQNAILAKTVVISKKFNELVQKQAARQTLPCASEQDILVIDNEIEESVEKEVNIDINPVDDIPEEDMDYYEEDINKKIVAGNKPGSIRRVKSAQ